jgi:hypothetical protein
MARTRPLAELLDACLGPSLAAQGFAASDILLAWPEIVGDRLARASRPLKVEWRRGPAALLGERPEPATLVVRVESALALDLQHLGPLVIQRVNARYGWRCIGRLVLKQGPVRREAPTRADPPPLSEADRRRLAGAVADVADEGVRAALDRLGRAVIGAERTTDARAKT